MKATEARSQEADATRNEKAFKHETAKAALKDAEDNARALSAETAAKIRKVGEDIAYTEQLKDSREKARNLRRTR